MLSFLGFTPAENPELLVYVVVDNPQNPEDSTYKYTVKDTAVPLEQTIMSSLLEYRNVTPAVYYDEEGAPISLERETDAEGNPVGTIEPVAGDRNGEWEEVIPEGGFIEGQDDGPPEGSDPELEAEISPEELADGEEVAGQDEPDYEEPELEEPDEEAE